MCVCVLAPAALCSYMGLNHPGHLAADRLRNLPEGSGISSIFYCCELTAISCTTKSYLLLYIQVCNFHNCAAITLSLKYFSLYKHFFFFLLLYARDHGRV